MNKIYYFEDLFLFLKKNFKDSEIVLNYDLYVDEYEILVKKNGLFLSIMFDDIGNLSIISYGSKKLSLSIISLLSDYCKGSLIFQECIESDGKNIGTLYKFGIKEYSYVKIKKL